MKKRVISVLLTAVMIMSLLAGCSGSGDGADDTTQGSNSTGADSEKVTLTYWGWDSNYYEPMIEAYMASHPDVVIEATAVEWGDMLTKAQQALASGSDLPTIIPMDIALIANWKGMGILENLTDYGLETGNYSAALIEAATDDNGSVIGLFENICPAGIAYKRDLAKEYFGTDDPEELQAMFTSYEDYVEKGEEVSKKSGGSTYLFHSGQAVAEWLYFASDITNVTDSTINMSEKMTDVMGKLVDLRDAGAVDTYQNGTAEANATYTDDEHIFYPCPDWALTYYIESNDPEGAGNWGLLKAPVSYNHGGTAMGISNKASDAEKKAAYDFITWCISSEEGAKVARDASGYITQDTTIATTEFSKRSDEAFFGGQDISSLYYQEIISEISIAAPSAFDNDIVSTRNDVAQQLMNDPNMTLDDAVAAAVEELSQLVTSTDVTIK